MIDSPGLSSVPAKTLPIITQLAPAARAFTISPVYRIPPSLMIPTFLFFNAAATSITAVICGTPVPATIRVVQIEPGPMPTFTASAPASANALAPAPVPTLPAITCSCLKFFFTAFKVSITPLVCPWALSRQMASTPACCKAATLSKVSFVIPTPAPTSNLPYESFTACG